MALIYIDKIPGSQQNAFDAKVKSIAASLSISANWLMMVMKAESGLNPGAINPHTGASGLIQFMPSTALGLGTTVGAIRKMSAIDQLTYVYKYYKPFSGKMKSYYDVYAATFFPAIIGKPDSWVLQTSNLSPAIIARQNPAINKNGDSKITVAEFKEYVKNTIPKSVQSAVLSPTTLAGGGALLLASVYLYFKL